MLKESLLLNTISTPAAPAATHPIRLNYMPQGDIANGTLVTLPDYPVGDVDAESGDFEFGVGDLDGEIEYYDQGDTEMGAPRRKVVKAGRLANRLATKTATPSQKKAAKTLTNTSPKVGSAVSKAATIKAIARNTSITYENVKGGRLVSSDLGVDARLRPSEVDALKAAIHLSTPFSPRVFNFNNGTFDIATALNSVIGSNTIYNAGLLITLSASTLNISQGAVITIVRHLGVISGAEQNVSLTVELDSGVAAVEILLLNGVLISGRPRFYAPLVSGSATVQASSDVDITGLPANYTATARFLQPGDHQVERFTQML